ncbi:MAG: chemotaxis protein CheX [Nannocystaceae bacterium]|nr:chemotaxis protein CheX [Nannocystaceae bacterium]
MVEKVVRGVFSTTLSLDCEPGSAQGSCSDVRSTVGISGAWTGSISIELPRSLAVVIAAKMFNVASEVVSEADLLDAVSEVANQVAGGVKSNFPSSCSLEVPRTESLVPGEDAASSAIATQYVFKIENTAFIVVLSLMSAA